MAYGRDRKVLVANHDYTDEQLMHAGYDPAVPTRGLERALWMAAGFAAAAGGLIGAVVAMLIGLA